MNSRDQYMIQLQDAFNQLNLQRQANVNRMIQLQNAINQLNLQNQANAADISNLEIQKKEEERANSLSEHQFEYQRIENELIQAKSVQAENELNQAREDYLAAHYKTLDAVHKPLTSKIIDKITGNEENIEDLKAKEKDLKAKVKVQEKRVKRLERQQAELSQTFAALEQPYAIAVYEDGSISQQIGQAQAELMQLQAQTEFQQAQLQQLQNEYLQVQNQTVVQAPQYVPVQQIPVTPVVQATPNFVPYNPELRIVADEQLARLKEEEAAEIQRRAKFDADMLASEQQNKARLDAELARIDAIYRARPIAEVKQPVVATKPAVEVPVVKVKPTQPALVPVAKATIAPVQNTQPTPPAPIKSQPEDTASHYFDDEHIRAAKQKISDELGSDCDIPEVCDLATLNQLTDDLFKHNQQSQRENVSRPQTTPTPTHSTAEAMRYDANDAANYHGCFIRLQVVTTLDLRFVIDGNQFMFEMVKRQSVSIQMLSVTQNKKGQVDYNFYAAQFDSPTLFGAQSLQSQQSTNKHSDVEFQQNTRRVK